MSDLAIRNLFIIPTILFLIIFNIFPLIYSLGYSFTDFRASTNAPANFVGLQNYRDLLNDPFIWRNFTVTAKYVIVSVGGQVVVGFGMALLLNRDIPAQGAGHDAAAPADDAVDGRGRPVLEAALRSVLGHHQLRARPRQVRLAVEPDMALYAVAITDIWMWSPFVMLLSLAGLSAVPKHLYEAAAIDRAGACLHLLPHHPAAGRADPDDRDHLPHHGGVQDLRPRLHHDQPADHRDDLHPALQDGVPGVADRQVLARSPTSC